MKEKNKFLFALRFIGLFSIYFVAAKLALNLTAVRGFAALVWPSTGISLAALLVFGYRYWPAIFLAAFLTNYTTGAPAWVSCAIAAGNALEAVLGAYLLHRYVKFSFRLERLIDVLGLLFFAAILSTALSASIGVFHLCFGKVIPWQSFLETWKAWWVGDALGNLIIAPLIFVWISKSYTTHSTSLAKRIQIAQWIEGTCLVVGVSLVSLSVFNELVGPRINHLPITYTIFPFVIWVALRFSQFGTVNVMFLFSIITVWSTLHGHGPFADYPLKESLFYLQTFQGVVAVTGMILAAITSERHERTEELKKALQARDEFLSIASHELKTPLSSLSLQLQLLRRNLSSYFSQNSQKTLGLTEKESVSPDKTVKMLENCEKQSKKLASLLDELLDLTRIRNGKLSISVETVNLNTIVSDVVERQQLAAIQAGIPISIQMESHITGQWDRLRLDQVVTNLLSNAIKYGNGKPITITAERSRDRSNVILKIQDQGIGIAPEQVSQIFGRFERVVSGQNIPGLGLGLYITRQIVEAHQGEIEVQSNLNSGSTFIIKLPLESRPGILAVLNDAHSNPIAKKSSSLK